MDSTYHSTYFGVKLPLGKPIRCATPPWLSRGLCSWMLPLPALEVGPVGLKFQPFDVTRKDISHVKGKKNNPMPYHPCIQYIYLEPK